MSKIILITHQKGGVGKSTIAYNLASNIRENAKVCITDMDSRFSY
jgi:chromosome partitioning protein